MKVAVQTKNGAFTFDCDPGEKVLFAGLRQGFALPYECGTGTCGTCKARVLDGPVEPGWLEAPGRSYVKPDRGEFLMCQALCSGDCTIQVPGKLPVGQAPRFTPGYLTGRIVGTKDLTHDVRSFVLASDPPLDFDAGQFVVVEAPGVVGGRAYSMVNFAPAARTLDFVVKRKPGGKFSDWLFRNGVVGAELRMFGPLGRAIFRPEEDKNILCIGGGSGIAGMMSIVARACGERYFERHRGDVFFGVRTARDVFYLDELSAFVAAFPEALRVTVALSDEEPTPALSQAYPRLRFTSGFVHAVTAQEMAGKYDNVIAYVGGPPPMVDGALRMLILEARLPASDIRYDKFG